MRTVNLWAAIALTTVLSFGGLARADEPGAPPKAAEVLRQRAVAFAQARRYPEARKLLDQAIALAPEWAELYFLRAGVGARQYELAKADPGTTRVAKIGLLESTTKDLEKYEELEPGGRDAQRVETTIQQLHTDYSALKQVEDHERAAKQEEEAALARSTWHVSFKPERPDQHWTLTDDQGKRVCALPCAARLKPGSGWKLVLNASDPSDNVTVAIPDDLAGYALGTDLRGIARPQSGAPLVSSVLMVIGLSSVAVGGGLTLGFGASGDGGNGVSTGLGVLTAGAVVGLTGLLWMLVSHWETVDFSLAH
jgi:hypothetical protein